MSVTEHDVRNIALLARLALEDARIPALVEELNGILAHMDVLQSVDVTGAAVESLSPGMWLRPDGSASVPLSRARADFAPEFRDGFFLVPRLATHGDAAASVTEDDAE